jgi:hypothetical protein
VVVISTLVLMLVLATLDIDRDIFHFCIFELLYMHLTYRFIAHTMSAIFYVWFNNACFTCVVIITYIVLQRIFNISHI